MDGFAEGENEEEKGEIVLEKPGRQVEINVIGFDEGKETNDVGVNENALSEYRLVFLVFH